INDNTSRYALTLSGTQRSPKIDFHPPFLMLMPVPLDVETEAVVTIIPKDFIRQSQIRVKLPEKIPADNTEAKACPFSVRFPKGQDIILASDGTTNELTCCISFKSSKPMSFLEEIVFIDQEENNNFCVLFSTGSHFWLLEQQTIVFLPYTRTWHCTAWIKKL
ncbi:CFA47 protein, partial [Phainopepla nitens]|nr:CFA47 protein [Phainopepla nitens]